jgi:hypothetical protein
MQLPPCVLYSNAPPIRPLRAAPNCIGHRQEFSRQVAQVLPGKIPIRLFAHS